MCLLLFTKQPKAKTDCTFFQQNAKPKDYIMVFGKVKVVIFILFAVMQTLSLWNIQNYTPFIL